MLSDSDWNSHSMDSHSSNFNDQAEAILMNANFEIDAPRGGEEDNQLGSTSESHKGCQRNYGHGQGASIYSCSCYDYKKMARYKYLNTSPPDPDQACHSCADCTGLF